MNDFDYWLTMVRLKRAMSEPMRPIVIPIFWSDGVNIKDRPIKPDEKP